jgi:hypothetical protein
MEKAINNNKSKTFLNEINDGHLAIITQKELLWKIIFFTTNHLSKAGPTFSSYNAAHVAKKPLTT